MTRTRESTVGTVVLDVVVPVYNEEVDLAPGVRRLRDHLAEAFPYSFRVTIADNGSTDGTAEVAAALADELAEVVSIRLAEKGRGHALKHVWSTSDARVVAYMDIDLSTDLAALLPLVAPLISGHSDVAIGTRLSPGSRVVRGAKREFVSRCYNLLLRGTLAARFSDAQCGFKAVRTEVAALILPVVEDTGWFFDTELLVLAERAGLRIHEVPVDWVDDPDSRVEILSTAFADLRGIARLGRGLATGRVPLHDVAARFGRHARAEDPPDGLTGQLVRFFLVGVASTLAYLLLFTVSRGVLGSQAANVFALLTTTVANTAANRVVTFRRTGPGFVRQQAQGLVLLVIGLGLTSGALALAHSLGTPEGSWGELVVLVGANITAGLVRFLSLRRWVFRR